MKMTLTQTNALERQGEEIARRNGESFKAVVNATVRRGLDQAGKPQPPRARFVLQPKACGFPTGGDRFKLNRLVEKLPVSTAGR